jgi:hypothetical protein
VESSVTGSRTRGKADLDEAQGAFVRYRSYIESVEEIQQGVLHQPLRATTDFPSFLYMWSHSTCAEQINIGLIRSAYRLWLAISLLLANDEFVRHAADSNFQQSCSMINQGNKNIVESSDSSSVSQRFVVGYHSTHGS